MNDIHGWNMAEKKNRIEIVHRDLLDREIKVGSFVVASINKVMHLAIVIKLHKKMVKIKFIPSVDTGYGRKTYTECNRFPYELIIVDGPYVTAYVLREGQ